MKFNYVFGAGVVAVLASVQSNAQCQDGPAGSQIHEPASKAFYLDVHDLGEENVTAEAVAIAHATYPNAENEYGVNFIRYWVDGNKGLVYCLSSAPDSASVTKAHAKAHGLLPAHTYLITDDMAAKIKSSNNLFWMYNNWVRAM